MYQVYKIKNIKKDSSNSFYYYILVFVIVFCHILSLQYLLWIVAFCFHDSDGPSYYEVQGGTFQLYSHIYIVTVLHIADKNNIAHSLEAVG